MWAGISCRSPSDLMNHTGNERTNPRQDREPHFVQEIASSPQKLCADSTVLALASVTEYRLCPTYGRAFGLSPLQRPTLHHRPIDPQAIGLQVQSVPLRCMTPHSLRSQRNRSTRTTLLTIPTEVGQSECVDNTTYKGRRTKRYSLLVSCQTAGYHTASSSPCQVSRWLKKYHNQTSWTVRRRAEQETLRLSGILPPKANPSRLKHRQK